MLVTRFCLTILFVLCAVVNTYARNADIVSKESEVIGTDSLSGYGLLDADSAVFVNAYRGAVDSAWFSASQMLREDSLWQASGSAAPQQVTKLTRKQKRGMSWKELDSVTVSIASYKHNNFTPNPKRATWLALMIPGAGQIYNHKFWKLPIYYGGFLGCAYALTWNGQMYQDYSQAYVDVMDNDPNTNSFVDFISPNVDINSNLDWVKSSLKSRRDRFRRYRDLSIFCFAGVYLLSVIDAYVDAELSHFDISSDLTLDVEPTLFRQDYMTMPSMGFHVALNF